MYYTVCSLLLCIYVHQEKVKRSERLDPMPYLKVLRKIDEQVDINFYTARNLSLSLSFFPSTRLRREGTC